MSIIAQLEKGADYEGHERYYNKLRLKVYAQLVTAREAIRKITEVHDHVTGIGAIAKPDGIRADVSRVFWWLTKEIEKLEKEIVGGSNNGAT